MRFWTPSSLMACVNKRFYWPIASGLLLLSANLYANTPWAQLDSNQRSAMAPLEQEWSSYPASQQDWLLQLAKGYAKLSPEEQPRFRQRLKVWSNLSAAQREQIRKK